MIAWGWLKLTATIVLEHWRQRGVDVVRLVRDEERRKSYARGFAAGYRAALTNSDAPPEALEAIEVEA